MNYDIKFKGTEEQIAQVAEILHGKGVKWNTQTKRMGTTLFVYDPQGYPAVMQCLSDVYYNSHSFKEVDTAGFIDAHTDMPGNPWVVAGATAPNTGNAPIQILRRYELEDHILDLAQVSQTAETWGGFDMPNETNQNKVVKWRFANIEDAKKYYGTVISGAEMAKLVNSQPRPHKERSVAPPFDDYLKYGKVKSDGGSTDYYKITIRTEEGEFDCEMTDIIRAVVNNDFSLGNVLKAVRRIYEASQGRGKEGIDVGYDANKIKYFVDDFVEHM